MTTTTDSAPQNSVDPQAPGADGEAKTDHVPPPELVDGPPAQDPKSAQTNSTGGTQDAAKRHSTFDIKGKYAHQKERIKTKTKPAGGYDSTPIPSAPPGYTVKFTFHSASNLPTADYGSGASDPFLTATLSTSLPKRHKEDADLYHRTPTIRRTTEPKWEDEWVIANVPSSGFKLKCRLYDEDWPDHNDRLGNVTIIVGHVDEHWAGFERKEYQVKKRSGSKRAYLLKAATSAFNKDISMTPLLHVSATLVGRSESEPNAQVHTLGPTSYFRHFSPMIGRLAGIQVNKDEAKDETHSSEATEDKNKKSDGKRTQKYDFQAIEMQLQGPVPEKLYHRYVEFKPIIGLMFSRKGLRGHVLYRALSHQHNRIYNFDSSTEHGQFKPCSEEASVQFLKMAHYDHGGRIFTYVLTLDGLFRFTETGKEFGIDLLSKHTMHSDVATYIACSGEFFIRRLKKPTASEEPEPDQPTHPSDDIGGGPPNSSPPSKPQYYQLVIDNDSGTYRPDKSVLPDLQKFLEKNFPGLGVVVLACDDDEDQKLKDQQRKVKKKEGTNIRMVTNRSPSASSFSSDDVSDLEELDRAGDGGRKSKRERMWDMLEQDSPMKGLKNDLRPKHAQGESSTANQTA